MAQIVNDQTGAVIVSIGNDWTGEHRLDWTGSGQNVRLVGLPFFVWVDTARVPPNPVGAVC